MYKAVLEEDMYAVKGLLTHVFGTGEAAEILDIPIWRLQKFLDSKRYQLTVEGRLGVGLGSRRAFSVEDLHRLAIATLLVQDGFAAPFIGSMLQKLDDADFGDRPDSEGIDRPLKALGFRRSKKGPELVLYASLSKIRLGERDSPYYVLDLSSLPSTIHARIEKLKK
jgi:hypothetical protein